MNSLLSGASEASTSSVGASQVMVVIPQNNLDDTREGIDNIPTNVTVNELRKMSFKSIVILVKKRHPQPTEEAQQQMDMKLDVLAEKYNEKHEKSSSKGQAVKYKALSSLMSQILQKYGPENSDRTSAKRKREEASKAYESSGIYNLPPGKRSRFGSNELDIPGLTDFSFLDDEGNDGDGDLGKEEKLSREQRRTKFGTMATQLASLIEAHIPSRDMKILMLSLVKGLSARYNKVTKTGEFKPPSIRAPHPKTPKDLLKLLHPNPGYSDSAKQYEEDTHPWRVIQSALKIPVGVFPTPSEPGLLLRAWDHKSECQIHDPLVGFLSGATHITLQNANSRKRALEKHSDWSNKEKTAFISATTSIEDIDNIWAPVFHRRQEKLGLVSNEKVTIINASARLANGWPVLRARDELEFYKAHAPLKYGGCRGFTHANYLNEYLLPYRIGPEETVTTWLRRDIRKWCDEHKTDVRGWYKNVAVVAFREHEKARKEGRPYNTGSHCTCCGGLHGYLPTASDASATADEDGAANSSAAEHEMAD